MSVTGLQQATRTATINPDDYDHAINLIDTTTPSNELSQTQGSSEDFEPRGASLSRKWTKGTLRGELARRKYAKWQEDKQVDIDTAEVSSSDDSDGNAEETGASSREQRKRSEQRSSRATRLRDKASFRSRRKVSRLKEDQEYEVDILYENQRGAFWCGIPLYSAKSLLNFDPAGWQTSSFQDSPVNIMNAQVPDPTWKWAWRTWYVDMSHDVDEEGWEYSFSFNPSFAWHGSHPWFHSFARRRRWLRKRVKVDPLRKATKDTMKAAHMLTADYFTIHPKREASPGSTGMRTAGGKSANYAAAVDEFEDPDDLSDITDMNALMTALKRARLDREKVVAIINFLDHGAEELFYLSDRMSEIMETFIYQTSRRQVLNLLLHRLDEATMTATSREGTNSDESRERTKDNLVKAIQAAGVHVNDQDYWSDLREKVTHEEPPKAPLERKTLNATQPSGDPGQGPEIEDPLRTGVQDDIKGIPEDADVSVEPGINWRQNSPSDTQSKGKEKA